MLQSLVVYLVFARILDATMINHNVITIIVPSYLLCYVMLIFMLAPARFFKQTANWTPGQDCFPLIVPLPLFYVFFFFILFHYKQR